MTDQLVSEPPLPRHESLLRERLLLTMKIEQLQLRIAEIDTILAQANDTK